MPTDDASRSKGAIPKKKKTGDAVGIPKKSASASHAKKTPSDCCCGDANESTICPQHPKRTDLARNSTGNSKRIKFQGDVYLRFVLNGAVYSIIN